MEELKIFEEMASVPSRLACCGTRSGCGPFFVDLYMPMAWTVKGAGKLQRVS
jgi:hypothetical protein